MLRPKKLIIFIMVIILAIGILTTMSSCNSQQNAPDISKPNAVSANVVYYYSEYITTLEVKDKDELKELYVLEQNTNNASYDKGLRSIVWEFTVTYKYSNGTTLKHEYIKNDNDFIKQINKFIEKHPKDVVSKINLTANSNSSTPTQATTK